MGKLEKASIANASAPERKHCTLVSAGGGKKRATPWLQRCLADGPNGVARSPFS